MTLPPGPKVAVAAARAAEAVAVPAVAPPEAAGVPAPAGPGVPAPAAAAGAAQTPVRELVAVPAAAAAAGRVPALVGAVARRGSTVPAPDPAGPDAAACPDMDPARITARSRAPLAR
jgi:hypothetical protein